MMEILEIPPMSMLCSSHKVNFAGMMDHVRVRSRELYAASQQAGLEVTGPLYWIYQGADGNPDTFFQLQIAIPVTPGTPIPAPFSLLRTEPFRCVSVRHAGPWTLFPEIYGKLLTEIQAAGHRLSGQNRELYLYMDFNDDRNHLTEIQIGIR
ncbi:MAG TPA: GyrI-like domain-containing protein [Chitinophagaceae bacterium]|nr:GyrI-like domain-containing protein [Chitinophagaceae bacterium]